MLSPQFRDLLDKYERGACSPDEEELVHEWYNNIGDGEQAALPEAERAPIRNRIWAAIKPPRSHARALLPWLTRAAVVTLPLLACAIVYMNCEPLAAFVSTPIRQALQHEQRQNLFVNHADIPQEITLADGSAVLLQPFSEIKVLNDFSGRTREIQLKGEAFFSISRDPDKPFFVYANEVVTRVLGTSFNIRAYENDREITVAVKTGKVSVHANKREAPGATRPGVYEEVILTPNQKMVYHRLIEKVSKKLVEEPEIIIPDSDLVRMKFENTEVSKIFDELGKNYGIEIRYDNVVLQHCKLTTSMSDEGLYERIAVICKAIGASYSIDDDAAITIQSDGC